jgi:hypothetical protein
MFTIIKRANGPRELLRKLREPVVVNPHAVAFILTERTFRGPCFRIAEICYGAFCVYVLRRDPNVTLGHCQVSFPYWRRRYGNNNVSLFLAALSDVASYEVCCTYLEANKKATLVETIICYNGKPSVLYAKLFFENLSRVQECVSQLRLATIGK